jgi:CO/xanthine dehydrogenase Mo-binding subunit
MSTTPVNETTLEPVEQSERLGVWSGKSVPRKEDRRLLQGQGTFTDDYGHVHQGYAHFVRSPYAHARILSVDTARAEALEGVYATLTGAEVKELTDPFFQIAPEPGGKIAEYCLAVDKVRYQGDAVAVVLADSRDTARDAAELVEVEYEPLPPVVDSFAAIAPDAPILHEEVGSNVVWHGVYDYGDVEWALQEADHVVKIDQLHFHRFSSTPLECNAAVVNWDPGTGVIDIFSNNQMPMFATMVIGPALRVPSNSVMFHSQDIGGAFGIKIGSYPQIAALALLSRKAGRAAKWTEYRTDHMLSSGHGNERTFRNIEVPVMSDGTILGFKVEAFDDAGAYLHYEPLGAVIWSQVVPGCYKLKHIRVDFTENVSNKCPTIPNRGYSRLQHLWMIERVIDIVAHELGFDPVVLRKKNYVQPEDYPYQTPNGCVYDSGDLPQALDMVLDAIDYPSWRERQRELGTGSGKRIGIGIGTTLDSGTNNFGQARIINPHLPFSGNGEAAYVKLDLYGEVNVNLGTTPQGQSHETTAAQVVADILGMSPDAVSVSVGFDARHNTYVAFSGTYASQFAVTGLGAAMGAAEKLRAEIVKVAAHVLGAEKEEIELREGTAYVRGDEERMIPFIGIANLVFSNVAALAPEIADSVSLNCRHVYRPPFEVPDHEAKTGNLTLTYATQTHACVLELDEETGAVAILDYAVADDCGRQINPQVVTGQVHGATAHGIGAALWETFEYDEDGQLQQSSFYDYHAVTALDVPHIKTSHLESPSPFTPNGAKGMGEGGGAPLHAICSAIQDGLGQDAPVVTESHNNWERIFRLLNPEPGEPRGVEVRSR